MDNRLARIFLNANCKNCKMVNLNFSKLVDHTISQVWSFLCINFSGDICYIHASDDSDEVMFMEGEGRAADLKRFLDNSKIFFHISFNKKHYVIFC